MYHFLGYTVSCPWFKGSSQRYDPFSKLLNNSTKMVAKLMLRCSHLTPYIIIEAATGIFKPAPPFSSLSSVPTNAIIFGSLLAVQRFGCKTAEFVRGHQDPWNDFFGCAVAYPYYQHFLVRHVILHNRVVGGTIVLAIAYANVA
jgi:hypothetical protein